MKRKYALPLLAAVAMVCMVGGLWSNSRTALLENDDSSTQRVELGIFLADAMVPLSALPEAEPLAAESDDLADLYEGLDEKQIAYVDEVLKLVNEARAEAGVPALELDASLRKAAQVRAKECVGTFSHTRPNGTSYKTAITEAGVESSYTGENVATGHTSAQQVVSRWLQSEGHRANILNANFTKIGIGLEKNTGNRYGGYAWAQLFVM